MQVYYLNGQKGQESARPYGIKTTRISADKKPSFDTNPTCGKHAEAPAKQALPANSAVGSVVTYNHTPSPIAPIIPIASTSPLPGYIPLVAERLAKVAKPRGWRAAKAKAEKERFEALYSRQWLGLGRDEKLQQVFHFGLMSEGVAFSLNFSAARLKRLMTSPDPARLLSQEMNRAARVCFGSIILLAFSFDVSPDGDRLHVHGIAIVPDFRNETLNRLRQMLKRAGGVVHGLGAGRQCSVDVYHHAEGWRGYLIKDQERTVEAIGTEKITFVSRELKQIAAREHNAMRAKTKARRKRARK
jgi:hypothetical protein